MDFAGVTLLQVPSPNGERPYNVHHIETAGAHPEQKLNMDNLIGIGIALHDRIHRHGEDTPAAPTFSSFTSP